MVLCLVFISIRGIGATLETERLSISGYYRKDASGNV